MKLPASLLLASLALVGCRPDTVELGYRYEPGTETTYRLRAQAEAEWDLGGVGSGSYLVVLEVSERIVSVQGDEAVVEVTMTPRRVEEQGLPPPGAEQRTFTLRLGANGEVMEVVEVDEIPARALEPGQLAFIGTYRPALPSSPVGLRNSWGSRQQVALLDVSQQIAVNGELRALDRDRRGRLALLAYTGDGPLTWTTSLSQGSAELTGDARTDTDATFDLETGSLRSARSATSGRFDVRVSSDETQLPVTGTLDLQVELTVTRVRA